MKLDTAPRRPYVHVTLTGEDRQMITVSQTSIDGVSARLRLDHTEAVALADCLIDTVEQASRVSSPSDAANVAQNPDESAVSTPDETLVP